MSLLAAVRPREDIDAARLKSKAQVSRLGKDRIDPVFAAFCRYLPVIAEC